MTVPDRETLARKLGYLQKNIDLLLPYTLLSKNDISDNSEKRFAVERLLQTSIESVIDCSRMLVLIEDIRKLRDEKDALLILADQGILTESLATSLLRAKGFRNVLVHEYVAIDSELLYKFLREDTADLQSFATALATWLQRK
jgi:uncharacterized protein YutE (UPF0331/DUF86 family)